LMYLLTLLLSTQCLAAEFFPSEARRQAFLRALEQQDKNYDPNERMLRAPFSSPGYHTTLRGGTVHRPRETLECAVALLDSGAPERLKHAEAILRRVIALQDQDPNSRTYGIWPWFLEEALNHMSPPDWNRADFCGTQLLQVTLDHLDRLPADLRQQVKDSILHAARSIVRRNVGPGYTNIALMGTYVTLVAGERFGVPDLLDYGKQRLRRFHDYTKEKGSFSEYNSPGYHDEPMIIDITAFRGLRQGAMHDLSQDRANHESQTGVRHGVSIAGNEWSTGPRPLKTDCFFLFFTFPLPPLPAAAIILHNAACFLKLPAIGPSLTVADRRGGRNVERV